MNKTLKITPGKFMKSWTVWYACGEKSVDVMADSLEMAIAEALKILGSEYTVDSVYMVETTVTK